MTDATIEVAGETLTLLPERAIFWAQHKTLLIADPHFGKVATFRANRIPVPEGNLEADLARLSRAIGRTGAETLVVLGDLLHTAQGRSEETLAAVQKWREQYHDLYITLVRGNHDRHAGDPPAEWRVRCIDAPLGDAPFVLAHHPGEAQDGYVVAGHLHPLMRLEGKGKQLVSLPCFWFGKQGAVLPAFGSFIDGAVIRPAAADRIYVIAGEQVLQTGMPP